jgi:benzoate-CoA ligase family protein
MESKASQGVLQGVLNVAAELLRSGAETPTRPALRVRTESTRYELDYDELGVAVRRFAGALRQLGVEEEQRVLIALPDVPELTIAFLGSIWAGAVPILVNPGLRRDDYEFFVFDTRARLVVVAASADEAIAAAKAAPGLTKKPTVWTVALTGERATSPFWSALEAASEATEPFPSRADDDAFWLYSSGTTGRPKGTVHRQRNILHVVAGYGRHVLEISARDVVFSTSRMFFAYGLGASLYLPVAVGGCSVISPEPFTPSRAWRVLREERPTLMFAVPSVYRALLDDPSSGEAALDSVRLCISAGEGLPESIFREWQKRFDREIVDGIGSTEALHIYVSNRPGQCSPGALGTPVPGYEVKIVDDRGSELGSGERGTMMVRGASLAARYWRRREASERAFLGEWFVTGDQAIRDAGGVYRVLGRVDELMKVAGQWVSPVDVEEIIREVDGVVECGVVSLPGADGLAELVACVVTAAASPADLVDAVTRHCAERLPRHSRPKRVLPLDALPRTATGKLQRFRLREMLSPAGPDPPRGRI